eukprot:SAG11_NODE_667_length_7841_cov_19.517954_3_plen_521_part_00
MRFVAVVSAAFLLCAGGGAAQQHDTSFTSTCDLSTLVARVSSLTSECCSMGVDGCGEPSSCTTGCLSVLLPLFDDCHDVMNRLFDGEDGFEDGEDRDLSDAYDQCVAAAPADLIDELKTLQDRGQCPPTVLNSVAATEVKAPGCADLWDGDHCSLSISSGIMTCEHDFCNTVYPPCVMAGQCDRSCNLCEDDGSGHRRLLAVLEKLRRLQMSHMSCNPATFADEAATVDAACCDDDHSCTNGIPGECDAKCAVVFNNFYSRCQRFLASQFSLAQMAGYDQLFSTCTRALPTEPLLRALVVCSANPPDPCFDVDCGEHGSCDGGTCQCEQGYSRETCDVFDPCASVDCGGHGSCVGGVCQCEDQYSGSVCETYTCALSWVADPSWPTGASSESEADFMGDRGAGCTSSSHRNCVASMMDGVDNTMWHCGTDSGCYVIFDVGASRSFSGIKLSTDACRLQTATLQSSTDGRTWNVVVTLNGGSGVWSTNFSPLASRYWKIGSFTTTGNCYPAIKEVHFHGCV